MNWFNRTNKDKDKKSENKSTSNNEAQKEIEKKSELKNIKEELKTNTENSDSISKKRHLVEQEYNDLVRDLMISKRE